MSGGTSTLPGAALLRGRTSAAAGPLRLDTNHFDRAIAKFRTGVALAACIDEELGGVRAMAVSSLTAIAAAPPTLMLGMTAGRTQRLITRSGHFGLSVLAQDQKDYYDDCGRASTSEFAPGFTMRGHVPVLPKCLAWFECRVVRTVSLDEYKLFISEIAACDHDEGAPLVARSRRLG